MAIGVEPEQMPEVPHYVMDSGSVSRKASAASLMRSLLRFLVVVRSAPRTAGRAVFAPAVVFSQLLVCGPLQSNDSNF